MYCLLIVLALTLCWEFLWRQLERMAKVLLGGYKRFELSLKFFMYERIIIYHLMSQLLRPDPII